MELRTHKRLIATLAALGLALLALGAGPALAQEPAAVQPPSDTVAPPGYRLTGRQAVAAAERAAPVAAERRERPGIQPTAYTHGPGRWQVSYFLDRQERVQVQVDDASGRLLEAWRGHQVAWPMARGYEGAFGRRWNAPYVWLPLALLFLAPFVDPRRPFRLLHLDLLVLLAFGVSHAFFNAGQIERSVPLVYPVLVYLLVRLLFAGFRPSPRAGPLVPLATPGMLLLGIVFLVGFRVSLNLVDANVIDVGYAGVIGADKVGDGEQLYDGRFPEDNAHGDTYGPITYLAYLPWEQLLPWSGAWDKLWAAHAAALTFDLATLAGLFVLGVRLRPGPGGRNLGIALAYAWASYPYTLFVLNSNANDALPAALLVLALLVAASPAARGAVVGLAAAAKFAPVILAPLFATGTGAATPRGLVRGWLVTTVAFAAVVLAAFLPFVPDAGLGLLWERTVASQVERSSPFSPWGMWPALAPVQVAVQGAAVALASAVAIVPRRRSPVQVAALGAAVLLAFQLALTHWFYLYIVWWAPFALLALFAAYDEDERRPPARRPLEERQTAGALA